MTIKARTGSRRVAVAFVVFTLAMIGTSGASAAPGDLDETFSDDGLVADVRPDYSPAVAIGPDGSIVLGGWDSDGSSVTPTLTRYRPDGTLDSGFGSGGIAAFASEVGTPVEVAVQPDGKVVFVGVLADANRQQAGFAVARLQADGTLDPSFAGDGAIATDFGGDVESPTAVVVDQGVITVAGHSYRRSPSEFAVGATRIDEDGDLDTTFSDDGKFRYDPSTFASGSEGGAVMSGDSLFVLFGTTNPISGYPYVLKLDGEGALDASFGLGGVAPVPFDNAAEPRTIAIDPAGRLVVAASRCQTEHTIVYCGSAALVERLMPDGQVDQSFGSNGRVSLPLAPSDMVVDGLGRVLVSGDVGVSNVGTGRDSALARLTESGVLDQGFSTHGTVTTDFDFSDNDSRSMAIAPDGKVVVSGSLLARYEMSEGPADGDADGVLDAVDACPTRFAKTANGCPAIEVELSIRSTKSKHRLRGRVKSLRAACVAVRKVVISRRAEDRRRRVDKVTSEVDGRFSLGDRRLRKGRYDAKVKSQVAPAFGECGSAESGELRIRSH